MILATLQKRLIGLPKVQNSTLHRKQSRYPSKIRIFAWGEAPTRSVGGFDGISLLSIFAGNRLIADEGMVFLFYGLNGAEMPHSVLFGQQADRKRRGGRHRREVSGAVEREEEASERFMPVYRLHFRLGEAKPIGR